MYQAKAIEMKMGRIENMFENLSRANLQLQHFDKIWHE